MPAPLISLDRLVFLAGLLHFYEVPAILFLPRAHSWDQDLRRMAPINRKVVLVLRGGIVMTVLGLGALVMLCSSELVSGGRLATGLAGFLAALWSYRALMQSVVFSRDWPKVQGGRLIHNVMLALFAYLACTYWTVVIKGISRG